MLLVNHGNDDDDESDDRANSMKDPTTEVLQASCNAEERRGVPGESSWNDFYPCLKEEEDKDEESNEAAGEGGGAGGAGLKEQSK